MSAAEILAPLPPEPLRFTSWGTGTCAHCDLLRSEHGPTDDLCAPSTEAYAASGAEHDEAPALSAAAAMSTANVGLIRAGHRVLVQECGCDDVHERGREHEGLIGEVVGYEDPLTMVQLDGGRECYAAHIDATPKPLGASPVAEVDAAGPVPPVAGPVAQPEPTPFADAVNAVALIATKLKDVTPASVCILASGYAVLTPATRDDARQMALALHFHEDYRRTAGKEMWVGVINGVTIHIEWVRS